MKASNTRVEILFPSIGQPAPAALVAMRDGHFKVKLALELIPQRLLQSGQFAVLRMHNESAQLEMKSEIVERGTNWLKLRMPQEAVMTKKRSHTRIQLNAPVRLRSLDEPEMEPIEGVVIDLSVGGMQLILHSRQTLPERVSVEFEMFEEDVPIKATARVAWSKVFKDSYLRVGLQFLEMPRIDLLRIKRLTDLQGMM